jgi:hypothetical protein
VEDTIQVVQHGLGLAPGTNQPLLGEPLANHSAELDALAAYLTTGIRAPVLKNPTLDQDLEAGRTLYVDRSCVLCHGGSAWTVSHIPASPGKLDADENGMVDEMLHDVGTASPRDVRGTTGFDVPSLIGLTLSAPYFHDGSMLDLPTLLRSGHPHSQDLTPLTEQEIRQLTYFLQTIQVTSPAFDLPRPISDTD